MEKENRQIVGMADIKIGKAPGVITTNLGSCIAVCCYSSKHQAGGILHLMLAKAGDAVNRDGFKKAKYADTGIPELLKKLRDFFKLENSDFSARFFGGAKILQHISQDIGKESEAAVRAILKDLGIRVTAFQTGGAKGYKINLDLSNGKIICQILGEEPKEYS